MVSELLKMPLNFFFFGGGGGGGGHIQGFGFYNWEGWGCDPVTGAD